MTLPRTREARRLSERGAARSFVSAAQTGRQPLKVDGAVNVGQFPLLGTAEEVAEQLGDGEARGGAELIQQLLV